MRVAIALFLIGLLSNCAVALQRDGGGIPTAVTVIISLVSGGGLTALFLLGAQRRATNASAEQLSADAELKRVEATRRLIDDVTELYKTVSELRASNEKLDKEVRHAHARADRLEAELRAARELMAAVLTANRMRDPDAFTALYDLPYINFGVIVTSTDGGRFESVNRGFAEILGYTKDEVLRRGWEGLVAPEDRERTAEAEKSARFGRINDFRNHFIRADGSRVYLSWHALEYLDDKTFAFVFVIEDDTPTATPMLAPPARLQISRHRL